MVIRFLKRVERVTILNPKKDFEKETKLVEVRIDPLTGSVCRINVERSRRPHHVVKEFIKPSLRPCPFCPENIEKVTPKFPPEIVKKGRIKVGEFTLFPNLYPFASLHAVGVLTESHFLPLNEFSEKIWKDCMVACIEFFKKANRSYKKLRFPSINLNYLSPAGASLVHPHVQVLITEKPSHYLKRVFNKCKLHEKKFGIRYFDELVKVERELKLRYVGRSGSVHWIVNFAPTLNHEILGILKVDSITRMSKKHVKDLSEGIVKVFEAYHEFGILSVNMSIFSGPVDERLRYFNCFVKIASRSPDALNISDRGFMEEFHEENVISTVPEEFSSYLKKFF